MSANTTGHQLIDAFSRGEASAMRLALAPDAVFHSPVADYRGHDQIASVLDALLRVLHALLEGLKGMERALRANAS